ncbi:hypothetical protein K1719_027853 [Acacia pycnantha]|nr:hypothetical protein K1719_045396 [Acacia pycnantha]KAI9091918.1 hypothetical protein K1719_027853 [Acacia pycnantha]
MYQKGMDLGDSGMSMRAATGYPGDHAHSMVENGALTFDMDYVHWLNEHQQLINDLRSATNNSSMEDNELDVVVEGVTAHYDELFRLKSKGTKADVFHMLFGMWKTPAETCFMWLGGFRPSELLEILLYGKQLEPFTEIEKTELYNLKQCSLMAEGALSAGMEALERSLSNILCSNSAKAAQYKMVHHQHMELAMSKLHNLEGFLHANLCRLAEQNQETKRKSRSEEKGIFTAIKYPRDHCHSLVGNGAMAFDKDYERWVYEQKHVTNNLRRAFNSQVEDNNNDELHAAILAVTSHYDELFRLKSIGTNADVFHMLSGSWKMPGERCFMWLGGFQSSELINIMRKQFEALTEEKLMVIYSMEKCSLETEDALSQGMEALRQSLFKLLSSSATLDVVAEHNMDQMALAVSCLHALEAFLLEVIKGCDF